MTVWAIIKGLWKVRMGVKKADQILDSIRDDLKAKIIKRGKGKP